MRRAIWLVLALAWAPAATAAAPTLSVQASAASGPAPLAVTLAASGDAASYHWDFGDGAGADGQSVQHTYGPGAFTATVTAMGGGGETVQAQVAVTAYALSLAAPRAAGYKQPVVFRGRLLPARRHAHIHLYRSGRAVGSGATTGGGDFRIAIGIRAPGPYQARFGDVGSSPVWVLVRPVLEASLDGPRTVGAPLTLVARLQPAGAGAIRVRVWRAGREALVKTYGSRLRLRLGTDRPVAFRIRLSTQPAKGFAGPGRTLSAVVVEPRLAPGSTGPSVIELANRLTELRYLAPRGATAFSSELLDGVYAFQKVQGLPRTGVVDASTWAALATPRVPRPRYASLADHLEIDKGHQVLYVVRGGQIALIVPVSTAGIPGYFTPVGRFSIYRKVVGFDPSPLGTLFDPMYFTGGYAIHGNPSVPPYPASHGCVRVPMWVAPMLFSTNPYGETVYVY